MEEQTVFNIDHNHCVWKLCEKPTNLIIRR